MYESSQHIAVPVIAKLRQIFPLYSISFAIMCGSRVCMEGIQRTGYILYIYKLIIITAFSF